MREKRVEFFSDELRLEGILEIAKTKEDSETITSGPGVVLCHPHSLYGGRMDNNVTQAVSIALGKRGISALRFNFRGVEGSEGSFDEGEGETRDALAAISFLASQEVVAPSRVGVMGYSFGGAVALTAGIYSKEVKAAAAVAPAGLPRFEENDIPRLIICGSEDEIVSIEALLQEEEDIKGPSGAGSIEIVQGADHFWWGFEEQIAGRIADFFVEHL